MNMKANILICGASEYANSDLINEAVPAGFIPENTDEGNPVPQEDNDADAKPENLIRRIVETPVANFIEANELSCFDSEERFPECRMLAGGLLMADYVKKIEDELRSRELLPEGKAKIDVIWCCAGNDYSLMNESCREFIRSATGVPNALIVASPMFCSSRVEFKKEINALTGLIGKRRLVLAPSASSGFSFSIFSAGTHFLIRKTERLFLKNAEASDAEKEAFQAAWTEFYKEKTDEWRETADKEIADCIETAAGRARFILGKPADVSLPDLVDEGVDMLGAIIEILRGTPDVEVKPRRKALAHTAELKDNIELMIYEIASCYGCAATDDEIELIFRHSRASELPKDAAAVTYAVGQVANAVFVPEIEYNSRDLLSVYRDAKEKAMKMEFKPHNDDDPLTGFDPDPELTEEDFEEPGDGQEDGEAENGRNEPDDGIHEPGDGLPEDCVAGCGSGDNTDDSKETKD